MCSSASKAWIVAASIGAVEALKDQAAVSNEIRKASMKRKISLERSMNLSCWGPKIRSLLISNVTADQLIQVNPWWNELLQYDFLDPKL
ncbi:hypothetical protein POTOM_003115 [Populus tomentosa]|uniref:Uncharacterized protein n=1 Tax=Populus tomentosa TaxID=118781 RepID=A0A8X8DL15_POPTO|nr:hypothetical protein POTOM_003115 [Populus tomentosa]